MNARKASELGDAAYDGNTRRVIELLNKGANIDERGESPAERGSNAGRENLCPDRGTPEHDAERGIGSYQKKQVAK